IFEAIVRFRGRAKSGVLPHRPQFAAIHRLLNSACERELTRQSDLRFLTWTTRVTTLDLNAGIGFELSHTRLRLAQRPGAPRALAPKRPCQDLPMRTKGAQ